MLTSDLLLADARSSTVVPRYLDARNPRLLEAASEYIALFKSALGSTRGELKAELDQQLALCPSPLREKGWVKLLQDRSSYECPTDFDLVGLREKLFTLSTESWGRGDWTRAEVLAKAGEELGLPADQVEQWMYADLKDEEVLREFKPLSARHLLDRYNTALAQAVLYKALALEITLGKNPANKVRDFFRALKFHRLLHEVRKTRAGYSVRLDGPLSLFGPQNRYGLRMACMLPHLLELKAWKLRAELAWGPQKRPKEFRLDDSCALTSHLERGSFLPDELDAFAKRFAEVGGAWSLAEATALVPLGDRVVVPDFRFEHESGRVVDFEVMGYWRRASVLERLEQLRAAGRSHYLLGVAKDLSVDKKAKLPDEVYRFRSIPNAQKVRDRLDAMLGDDEGQGLLFPVQ